VFKGTENGFEQLAGGKPGSFFKRRMDAGIRRMIGGRERENCVMPYRSPTECQKHILLTHKWLAFFAGQQTSLAGNFGRLGFQGGEGLYENISLFPFSSTRIFASTF
jgi:hypothetical protein